jgi:4-coumarate--CoA ligase
MMIALAKESVMKKYNLWSLRQVVSGAVPLGRDVMEECAKVIPHADIFQVLGYN